MFDRNFFESPLSRTGTDCRKWDDRAILPEGGIPLWVADMDFPGAPAITEAIQKRAAHPVYGYTYVSKQSDDAVCSFWQRRHQVTLAREQLLMMPSVVSGLRACVLALTKPEDTVMIFTPVYGPFYAAVKDSGRSLLEVPLMRDAAYRYSIDFDSVERHFATGKVAMLMLCSPHNPVSRLWRKEELQKLAALCRRYGVRLTVDEIHCDFVYAPDTFQSIMGLEEAPPETVSLTAPSKSFNIAGLKQAYLFCRDEQTMSTLRRFFSVYGIESGNLFALTATQAAYSQCDEWLDGLLTYLSESRETIYKEIARLLPQAHVTPIEATYLAWLDVSAYENDADALTARCYRHGVTLTNGVFFGSETGRGHMRLNFGCPRPQLKEGIRRFAEAVLAKE